MKISALNFAKTLAVTTAVFVGGLQQADAQCQSGFGFRHTAQTCQQTTVFDVDAYNFRLLRLHPQLAIQHRDLAIRLNLKYARQLQRSQLILLNGQVAGGQQVLNLLQPTVAGAVATPAVAGTVTTPAVTGGAAVATPAAGAAVTPAAGATVTPAAGATVTPAAGAAVTPAAGAAVTPAAGAAVTPAAGAAVTPAAGAAVTPAAPATEAAPAAPAGPAAEPLPADLPDAAPVDATAGPVVSDELKPILGAWRNVVQRADGTEQTTDVELSADGSAKVTVDAGLLGRRTIEGTFAVDGENFNITEGENTITLGKVVSASADQVVLQRGESTLNFNRPS